MREHSALDRGVCVCVFMSELDTAVARVLLVEGKLLLKSLTIGDLVCLSGLDRERDDVLVLCVCMFL